MRAGLLHRTGGSLQASDDWPGEPVIIAPMPTEPIGSKAAWWIWNLSISLFTPVILRLGAGEAVEFRRLRDRPVGASMTLGSSGGCHDENFVAHGYIRLPALHTSKQIGTNPLPLPRAPLLEKGPEHGPRR